MNTTTYKLITSTTLLTIVSNTSNAMARPGIGYGGFGGMHGFISHDVGNALIFVLIGIGIFLFYRKSLNKDKHNKCIISHVTAVNMANKAAQTDIAIAKLQYKDSYFSKPVFLDFVSQLYIKYYKNDVPQSNLQPFFYNTLTNNTNHPDEVIVESAQIINMNQDDETNNIIVDIKAEITNKQINAPSTHQYIEEKWMFSRLHKAKTNPKNKLGLLQCPYCGEKLDISKDNKCSKCSNTITQESGQWIVTATKIIDQYQTTTEEIINKENTEKNTNNTIISPDLDQMQNIFAENNPELKTYQTFVQKIAKKYFLKIYEYWSNGQWEETKKIISSRQWNYMNSYIKRYKDLGYINIIKNVQIDKIIPVKYEIDNCYESITLRIFASCNDYIANIYTEIPVAGEDKLMHKFNEYWTFIAPRNKTYQNISTDNIIDANETTWILYSITQDNTYIG